jgi:hypothetical protein
MRITLPIIFLTLMKTPALANNDVRIYGDVRSFGDPPVAVQSYDLGGNNGNQQQGSSTKKEHTPPASVHSLSTGDNDSLSTGDNDNQQQGSSEKKYPVHSSALGVKNADQQRAGNNNDGPLEETKECIPYDDSRAVDSAEKTEGDCQHNICDGGCCRYHSQFLTCDQKNDFSHQECICNNLTNNEHLLAQGRPDEGGGVVDINPGNPLEDPGNGFMTDVTVTPCAEGELDFSFHITTDSFGEETSWELVNLQGQSVTSGEYYTSDKVYDTRTCIPDDCYTLTIYDTYGDGMCCGNDPSKSPGYRLKVDGSILEAASGLGLHFGYDISFDFGSCEDISFNVDPSGEDIGFHADSGCELDVEVVCDEALLPSLFYVDLEETVSNSEVSCELTVFGEGVNDVKLVELSTLSNIFEDTDWTDVVYGETLSPGQTRVVPFTIELDLTIQQEYKFFSAVVGTTLDGKEECFASFFLDFTAGYPL